MRVEHVVESAWCEVTLTDDEARTLSDVGVRLASRSGWWGAESEESAIEASLIDVQPVVSSGMWRVRVREAVGVVSVGATEVVVAPKIPPAHLIYLLDQTTEALRIGDDPAAAGVGSNFWELVARAFVDSSERLLRLGLVRDYEERSASIETATGRIEVFGTAQNYLAGRLMFDCVFDDFTFDTPLNRILKEAASLVAGSPVLPTTIRDRAIRVMAWLDDSGPLRPSDLAAETDRRTGHYERPIHLARTIIRRVGRHVVSGEAAAWSFLIRTPGLVERAVLALIAGRIGASRVRKGRLRVPDTGLTLNPDLVFDNGLAVGDVKYKISDGAWDRSDLYEVLAFAAAYRATEALIVRFRRPPTEQLRDISVGDVHVGEVTWDVGPATDPRDAAAAMVDAVADRVGEREDRLSA